MKLLGYRTVYTYIAIISPNELKLLLRGKYHCYFKILFALFRPCKVKKLSVTAERGESFRQKVASRKGEVYQVMSHPESC